MAVLDALPMPGCSTASLDLGPSSRLGEDKVGLLPHRDEAEPLVMSEALGTWGHSFVSSPINFTTIPHPPVPNPKMLFS